MISSLSHLRTSSLTCFSRGKNLSSGPFPSLKQKISNLFYPTHPHPSHPPCTLFLRSTKDPNGALPEEQSVFEIDDPQTTTCTTYQASRISSIKEVNAKAKKALIAPYFLKSLTLLSHSNGLLLDLQTPYWLCDVEAHHFQYLSPQGTAIFAACQSASIAQKVAQVAQRKTFGTLFPYSTETEFFLQEQDQLYPLSFTFGMQNFISFQKDGTTQLYPIPLPKLLSRIPPPEITQRLQDSPTLILHLPKELTTQEQKTQAFHRLLFQSPDSWKTSSAIVKISFYLLYAAMHELPLPYSTSSPLIPKELQHLTETPLLLSILQNPKISAQSYFNPYNTTLPLFSGPEGFLRTQIMESILGTFFHFRTMHHPLIHEILYHFNPSTHAAHDRKTFSPSYLGHALIASYFWIQQRQFDRVIPLLKPLIDPTNHPKYEQLIERLEHPQLSPEEKETIFQKIASLPPISETRTICSFDSSPIFSAQLVLEIFRATLQQRCLLPTLPPVHGPLPLPRSPKNPLTEEATQ